MKANRRQLMIGGAAAAAAATLGSQVSGLAQDKQKITWWHITTVEEHKAAFQELADAYVAENPDIEIEITVLENEAFKQKLATAMQSGEPPDVFQSWGGGVLYQYADAGLVRDISPELSADGWGDSFLPGALGLYGRDGQFYGVPWNIGMVGFWYNKALFAQAGIEAVPTTWAELLTTVGTLKEAGITPITVGEGDKWPGHFYWVYLAIRLGGKAAFDAAYTREGSFADEPFVQAGATLKELIDMEPFQEGFLGMIYNDAASQIANGKAALELMGQWSPAVQSGQAENGVGLGEDLGFFTFPVVEGGAGDPGDALGGGDGFALGVNASDAAVDFVRYLTSVEAQSSLTELGAVSIPTVKEAQAALTDPNLQVVAEKAAAAQYFQLYYDQFLPPAVGGVVNESVQGLFAEQLSPEDVANAIEASAAQELAS